MSDLLNDSATASKHRDRITLELERGERILNCIEGYVSVEQGTRRVADFQGAIIVTSDRLLIAENKMLGRVGLTSKYWRDVVGSSALADGTVGVAASDGTVWLMRKWLSKKLGADLDKRALELLRLTILEARQEAESAKAAKTQGDLEALRARRGD